MWVSQKCWLQLKHSLVPLFRQSWAAHPYILNP